MPLSSFYLPSIEPPVVAPVKNSMASTGIYTSNHDFYYPIFDMAANEMKGKFQETSIDELLDMLPMPSVAMPAVSQDFSPILNAQSEVALYKPFVCCFLFHSGLN